MTSDAHDEALQVTVEEGQVVVVGPGAVTVTLTPAAAIETADRLQAAAIVALAHQSVG